MSHGQVSILFIRITNLQSMNQEKRAMEWLTHSLYDYHRYKGSSSMEPPFFSAQCTTNDYSYKIVFHCDLLHREREDSYYAYFEGEIDNSWDSHIRSTPLVKLCPISILEMHITLSYLVEVSVNVFICFSYMYMKKHDINEVFY